MTPIKSLTQDKNDYGCDFEQPELERIWASIQAVCGLFDMARDIKILQLKRQYPEAADGWIMSEALRMIEEGCK